MSYVAPMISGVTLFGIVTMSMLLKIDIQPSIMMLLALASVLLSLPAIKKFQFTKDGFSIEATESDHHQAKAPNKRHEISPDKNAVLTSGRQSFQQRMVPRALGLLYGAISGVLSASFGWHDAFMVTNGDIAFNSSWPAPPLPAIFYSIALFALLLPFRSVNKASTLILPLIIYVAWIAGFQISLAIFKAQHGPVISGAAGGIAGGLLLSSGLCIVAKEMRSLKAILATTAIGGVLGATLAVPLPRFGTDPSSNMFPLFGALFVSWQGAVSFAIAFFMTTGSEDRQKRSEPFSRG